MDAHQSPPPMGGSPIGDDQDQDVERWLHEARDGSPSALGRALEASRKYLLLVANRELDAKYRSKAGGSDLVQDTFLEAHRSFRAFRGQTDSEFLAWLRGIMVHRVANTIRLYRQTQCRDISRELLAKPFEDVTGGLQDRAATPATEFLARDDQRRVQLALDRLEEPWRTVLVERTWQGLAFSEIGVRRSCSADAARKLWARAVGKLQKLLARIE